MSAKMSGRPRRQPIASPGSRTVIGRSNSTTVQQTDDGDRVVLKDSNWVRELFVHDQWLWEGATDASPVQNRVRIHLEAVEVPKRVAPVAEDNR